MDQHSPLTPEALIRASKREHRKSEPTRKFFDLPDEYHTDEIVALMKRVEPILDSIITGPPLSDNEYKQVGILAQVFSAIDNNLHHCRRLWCRAGLLNDEIRAMSAREKLFKEVRRGIRRLAIEPSAREEALDALSHIKRLMKQRDKALHFIMKDIPGENAFLFLSARDRDSITISGTPGDPMVMNYSIMFKSDFARVIDEACRLESWLASKTREWHILLFGYEKTLT